MITPPATIIILLLLTPASIDNRNFLVGMFQHVLLMLRIDVFRLLLSLSRFESTIEISQVNSFLLIDNYIIKLYVIAQFSSCDCRFEVSGIVGDMIGWVLD